MDADGKQLAPTSLRVSGAWIEAILPLIGFVSVRSLRVSGAWIEAPPQPKLTYNREVAPRERGVD